MGAILFKDILREEAKDLVTTLHHTGIKTYILTGDTRNTGIEIGRQLGINENDIYTNLTPVGPYCKTETSI